MTSFLPRAENSAFSFSRQSVEPMPSTTARSIEHEDAIEAGITEEGIAAKNDHVIVKVGTTGTAPSCVKMKLNTFSKTKDVKAEIQRKVEIANIVLGEAYAFANFHILRLHSIDAEMPVIDEKFYWRAMMAVTKNNCIAKLFTPEWLMSIAEYKALRPEGYQPANIGGDFNAISASLRIVMSTAAINHLWLNLEKRILRFLSWKWPSLKRSAKKIQIAVTVLNKKPATDFFPGTTEKDVLARQVIGDLRALLPDVSKFGTRAHKTLPLYFYILRETEYEIERRKSDSDSKKFPGRMFNILPMKSNYTMSHIPFSSMAFMQILSDLGYVEYKSPLEASKLDHAKLWAEHFNLNAIETRNRRFAGMISTDGCAVSIILSQTSSNHVGLGDLTVGEIRHIYSHPNSLTVGVDPGITDVVSFMTSEGEHKKYSATRYYEDAMFNLSARRVKAWNNETQHLTELIPASKTASYETYKLFIIAFLASFKTLLQHRASKGYRNMRFMRFTFKKKTISKICDMIAPRDRCVVVGFGNWKGPNGTPISRKCVGPLQEIRRELKSRSNVGMLEIDEYCTSKRCCHCHGDVKNMRAGVKVDGKIQNIKKVHKVLHCHKNSTSASNIPMNDRCGKTFDRDFNAAKNILLLTRNILEKQPRPERFQRPNVVVAKVTRRKKG
jgi:hypothetical protein